MLKKQLDIPVTKRHITPLHDMKTWEKRKISEQDLREFVTNE